MEIINPDETTQVRAMRLDVEDAEPVLVTVNTADGTHVGDPWPAWCGVESSIPAKDTVTLSRAELAEMIATATAAAVAAQQSTPGATAELRQAAHTALTEEVL